MDDRELDSFFWEPKKLTWLETFTVWFFCCVLVGFTFLAPWFPVFFFFALLALQALAYLGREIGKYGLHVAMRFSARGHRWLLKRDLRQRQRRALKRR